MIRISRSGISVMVALAALPMLARGADNPFTYMIGVNDCDVLKYNGEYYLTGNWLAGDMIASRDLRSWGRRTHVFSYNNSWHAPTDPAHPDKDIHGSHLRYHNGTFHLYAHLEVTDGITHAESPGIWGPYHEPVDAPFAEWIDADTFKDTDGSLHFYSSRVVGGTERIYRKVMADPAALSGNYILQISPSGGWEGGTNINEGSKVFTYRDRYYMLYNAYATTDPNYALGCVEASGPTLFANIGKYVAAVLSRGIPGPGSDEVTHIGQPWVVEGPNGFEKWLGYFAETPSEGRTQRIDRLHFFDKTLHVDGPTNRYSSGYHPGPAKPQYLGLFGETNGVLPVGWTAESGRWMIDDGQLRQVAAGAARAALDCDAAEHYLFEINLKFNGTAVDQQAGARVYHVDDDNWLIVGLHRTATAGSNNFYYHLRQGGVDTVQSVALPTAQFNLNVYHKLRIERNGDEFRIRLDDRILAPVDVVIGAGFGPARPGLYVNNGDVSFDGVIYTIGWDEHDNRIRQWQNAASGVLQTGTWSVGAAGLTQSDSTGGTTFKGDLMPEYEFSTQVTDLTGSGARSMGIFAVAIDANNYLAAEIDQVSHQLFVHGMRSGAPVTPPASASVSTASSHNLRAVKLSDRVILFVDGEEKMTVPLAYGPSQVGLVQQNMAARYNGILVYRMEPKSLPAPWRHADVGTVGFAGSADATAGTFTLTASGGDIWNHADGMHFVYQPIAGDVDIMARVVHHGMTDWWQKAGVMIREDLTGGSRHAACVLSAVDALTGNAAFCSRIARDQAGGPSGAWDLSIATNNQPYWVRLQRRGNSIAAYASPNGLGWAPAGEPVAIEMPATTNVGLALSAHNNARITDATFDHVRVIEPLPSPWQSTNVGSTAYEGLAGYRSSATRFVVDGSGGEICCDSDAFRYVYQEVGGNAEIVARVVSLENTGGRAKAGIMFRESLDAGSRHYSIELHAGGAMGTNRRLVTDGASGEEYVAGGPFAAPYWLKLIRSQGQYFCYASPDGADWTEVVGPYADGFAGSPCYVGLLTCANNNADLCTAEFDNVQLTPIADPAIILNKSLIGRSVFVGDNLSADTFTVANGGAGTIHYTIGVDAAWLGVSPQQGNTSGEADTIDVVYGVSALPVGEHAASITVSADEPGVDSQTITVEVAVTSVAPDFDQDGDVDAEDFGHLQSCLTDFPPPPIEPPCADADLDGNSRVDGIDVDTYLNCMSGPEIRPDAFCDQ